MTAIDQYPAPAWASLLHDVASVLASAEAPERRVDRALELTTRALGVDRIALHEVVPMLARELTVVPGASAEETEILRDELADLARLLTEVPAHRAPRSSGSGAMITLPLVGIGEVIGMIRAERRVGAFDEVHVRVLSGVAALLASYLTVVRTQRELERTTNELRSVYQAGLVGIAFVDSGGAVARLNEPAQRMMTSRAPQAEGGAPTSCDEALRLAQARFAGIIQIALDAIIVVDDAQRIVLFNRGAERTFGYSAAEVLGRPLDVLVPERLRQAHHADIAAFAHGGGPPARAMSEEESRLVGVRKSGEEFPIEAAISRSESGGQVLLTAVIRDVSERKRADHDQQVLVASAIALGSTLDVERTLEHIATLGVQAFAACSIAYVIDADLVPRHVRAAVADPANARVVEAIQGAPIGDARRSPGRDMPGLRVVETRQPVLLSQMPAGYLEATAGSDAMRDALRELAPTTMIAVPLLARGRCLGALVLFGAPPRERFDARDLALAQEIAGRAALALDNAALYRAAREAVGAREDVLAIVAHDLRSPLNTIRLGASMLRDERTAPEAAQKTLDAILRAASRAERLISDLLDVHRIGAGTFAISREELPVSSLVADAIASQSPLARTASIELRADIAEHTPWVLADRDRVQQVFDNLIGNALRFTPAGGRITVSLEERESEVELRVTDTGPGLTSEELEHAFDRKWQRPRRERSGAGLGLAICRGIVEAHGGRIGVESTRGVGTTFWFTLPRCEPARAARIDSTEWR